MQISSKEGAHYQCPKCSATDWELDEIRTAGGFWSAIFNVASKRFASLTCTRCSYTELFRTRASAISKVTDLLMG